MKISIDTSQDSHDDIRKVIAMLKHLVGDEVVIETNAPEAQEITQEASSSFMNMFGGDSSSEPEPSSGEDSSSDDDGLMKDLFSEDTNEAPEDEDEEQEDKDEPQIQMY